jgi:hypothetical protein
LRRLGWVVVVIGSGDYYMHPEETVARVRYELVKAGWSAAA